ncbi:hypothetical protein ACWC10_36725 [Streptomyces sp. NPDC001595]|uniref:hypothetical protein n=1 Tax=Streptomyces sp. NPDC001532 TaxID=3154520 RepID=UPI0033308A5C
MRRAARVLSVVVLTAAVVGGGASTVTAEPAAEVSPSRVAPGGTVTVAVSCDPLGGTAPEVMEATSQAFEDGMTELLLVEGNDDALSGPAYEGTALIVLPEDIEGVDTGSEGSAWTVDGTCPAAPGGQGKPWSATFTVSSQSGHPTPHPSKGGHTPPPSSHHSSHPSPACPEPKDTRCGTAVVQRGVRAGKGGAFAGSVPALVLGGLLIAGAVGGAVYRLRPKGSRPDA